MRHFTAYLKTTSQIQLHRQPSNPARRKHLQLIYSQPLAEFASDAFLAELPAHAWRLDIHSNVDDASRSKQLVWLNEFHQPATIISFKSEPESSRWRRFQVWFYRFLPLESML